MKKIVYLLLLGLAGCQQEGVITEVPKDDWSDCSEYRRTGKGASEHQIQRAAGGFADCDHPQRSGYGQRTVELRYPAIGRYPPGAGIPPCREVRSTYPGRQAFICGIRCLSTRNIPTAEAMKARQNCLMFPL